MEKPLRRCLAFAPLLIVALLAACQYREARRPTLVQSDLDPTNAVFDLEEEDLRVVWRQELGQSTKSPLNDIYATGDYLVVEAAEGEVHVYDAATGQWKTSEVLTDDLDRDPVAWGNRLLFVAANRVYSFEVETGTLSDGYKPGFAVFTSPLIFRDSIILAGGDGALQRVELVGSEVEWQLSTDAAILEQPVLADGNLYAAGSRGLAMAVNAEEGTELWSWQPKAPSRLSTGVAVQDGILIVGDNLGTLYGLETDFGRLRYSKPLEAPVTGRPMVAEGRFLVRTSKPSLIALKEGGPDILWRYPGATRVIANSADVVYVLTKDNAVAGVSLAEGKELWKEPLPDDCLVVGAADRPAFYVANADGSIVAFEELQ